MKNLILAVALMSASSVSFAADEIEVNTVCDKVARAAKDIMTKRQNNFDVSVVMKQASHSEFLKSMVIDAWQVPDYRVESNQQREIQKFSNKHYLECLNTDWE